jgi:hypothetical protein
MGVELMGKQQKAKPKVIKERGEANPKPKNKLIEVSHLVSGKWEPVESVETKQRKIDFVAAYMEKLAKEDAPRKVGTVKFRSIV